MKISIADAAYIAGFFDGEGCIHGRIGKSGHPMVGITITQKRPEVLFWIKGILNMGHVNKRSNGTSRWAITGSKNIGRFIDLVLSYCKVKEEELIIGQKLNNLVGKPGQQPCSSDNLQEREILFNQLKLLKK